MSDTIIGCATCPHAEKIENYGGLCKFSTPFQKVSTGHYLNILRPGACPLPNPYAKIFDPIIKEIKEIPDPHSYESELKYSQIAQALEGLEKVLYRYCDKSELIPAWCPSNYSC